MRVAACCEGGTGSGVKRTRHALSLRLGASRRSRRPLSLASTGPGRLVTAGEAAPAVGVDGGEMRPPPRRPLQPGERICSGGPLGGHFSSVDPLTTRSFVEGERAQLSSWLSGLGTR